jgi:uncharacterized protein YigA (DUF484 family)
MRNSEWRSAKGKKAGLVRRHGESVELAMGTGQNMKAGPRIQFASLLGGSKKAEACTSFAPSALSNAALSGILVETSARAQLEI